MKRFCICGLLLCLCLSVFSCRSDTPPPLSIVFLDVGQGDAALIRTEAGDVLIDAGPEDAEELLCLRLEQLGVSELALAVFTHGDEDHIGGADGVLSQIPAREIWLGGDTYDNPAGRFMTAAANACGAVIRKVSAGEQFRLGELCLTVLYPSATAGAGGNADSVVLRVDFGDVSAIFSGDAGVEQELAMLEEFGDVWLDCDLYKVAHHGSNTSSSKDFLKAMSPMYAVISCGAGNSYGHPMGEVLSRLEAVEAEVCRTDRAGEIVFYSDGERIWREE